MQITNSNDPDLQAMGATSWQQQALALNRGYCGPSPYADVDQGNTTDHMTVPTWPEWNYALTPTTACVDFHFTLLRVHTPCNKCGSPASPLARCTHCSPSGVVYAKARATVSFAALLIDLVSGKTGRVTIARIRKKDMPDILKYLQVAAAHNAKRFSGIMPHVGTDPGLD